MKGSCCCRVVARAADAHRLNQTFSETPFDGFKFNPITEHQVSTQPFVCDTTSTVRPTQSFTRASGCSSLYKQYPMLTFPPTEALDLLLVGQPCHDASLL